MKPMFGRGDVCCWRRGEARNLKGSGSGRSCTRAARSPLARARYEQEARATQEKGVRTVVAVVRILVTVRRESRRKTNDAGKLET